MSDCSEQARSHTSRAPRNGTYHNHNGVHRRIAQAGQGRDVVQDRVALQTAKAKAGEHGTAQRATQERGVMTAAQSRTLSSIRKGDAMTHLQDEGPRHDLAQVGQAREVRQLRVRLCAERERDRTTTR